MHRLVAELTFGDAAGAVTRHECDQPSCCEATHLLYGSQADNMRDAFERGRNATGSGHGMAKLSTLQVLAIRADKRSQKEIAAEYGVSKSTVSMIQSGQIWKRSCNDNAEPEASRYRRRSTTSS